MSDKKYIPLKNKDIKQLREKLYKRENGYCPILKIKCQPDEMVLDHKHMKKGDIIGENGNGCIRNTIHNSANVVEGKIRNLYKRCGISKKVKLPELLRNLADYLENEPYSEKDSYFVHPSEISKINKRIKLKKSSYNQLCKKHKELGIKAKIPPYNEKTKKLTQPLRRMYEKCDIQPEFYKI